MPYAVIITLIAPAPIALASARQAVGDLLERHVAAARDAVDTGGRHVSALGHWSGVHTDGALLALILDAPDTETARQAATDLIAVLLHNEPALHCWTIAAVDVEQPGLDTDAMTQQSLSQQTLN